MKKLRLHKVADPTKYALREGSTSLEWHCPARSRTQLDPCALKKLSNARIPGPRSLHIGGEFLLRLGRIFVSITQTQHGKYPDFARRLPGFMPCNARIAVYSIA